MARTKGGKLKKASGRGREKPVWPVGYQPRVVVKFRDDVDLTDADRQLKEHFPGITIQRLITSLDPEKLKRLVEEASARAKGKGSKYDPPKFQNYFAVRCPSNLAPQGVVKALRSRSWKTVVEGAYVEGKPTPPPGVILSPNESAKQGHLDPSPANGGNPGGIDARYAWTIPGGDGDTGDPLAGLQFVDLEWGWVLDHADLPAGRINPHPIYGYNAAWHGHGTAVLGIVIAEDNNAAPDPITGTLMKDCVGITPHVATTKVVSPWQWDEEQRTWIYNMVDAIMAAINVLNSGDVLLLEAQTQSWDPAGFGYPIEVEEAVFNAIQYGTTDRGVVIIEAAGDLGEDEGLDPLVFNWPTRQFSLNRRSRHFQDSGAIMVGSANSRTRTPVNNVGSRIDCFVWDDSIYTTGYDDTVPAPPDPTTSYFYFSGTSGAAAIIAGAALAVQGIAQVHRKGDPTLNYRFLPDQLRSILSDWKTGTLSENSTRSPRNWNADKIGVMPDLQKIINDTLKIP